MKRPSSEDMLIISSDIWKSALDDLSEKDKQCLLEATAGQETCSATIHDLLELTNTKKAECVEKRWKVRVGDRTIILRDVLEKMSVWVAKIIQIGDIAVQNSPTSATLPWAIFKFLMKVSMNDVETFGYIMESVERIAHFVAVSTVLELQYLHSQEKKFRVSDQIEKTIKGLYVAILQYLAQVTHYLQHNTVTRFLKSIIVPKEEIESNFDSIQAATNQVFEVVRLADAEKTDSISTTVDRLATDMDQARQADQQALGKLEDILQELQRPVLRISYELDKIRDGLEKADRGKILRAISSIPFRLHHKAASKGRLSGSGTWLLKKTAFQQWRDRSSSSVIWLHGIPGSGKTKLASMVIDELEGNDTLAFFYCMRNPAEPDRGQADKIMASLVRQLAVTRSNMAILPPVVNQYEDALSGFADFEDQAWTSDECKTVLLELMQEYPSVTIVLDALDEVNQEDRQLLLDVLTSLLQESSNLLKVFISSRDSYEISLHLAGAPNVYIDADDNAADIQAYVETELTAARLLNGRLSEELRNEVKRSLLGGAQGMFRWVALQIQFLRSLKVAADIWARLGRLPATLKESYWEIFQQIQSSGDNAANLAIFTFQWLLYAHKTIDLDSFASIASSYLSGGSSNQNYEGLEVIDVCANLVIQRPGTYTFEFAHLSVREFFEGLDQKGIKDFISKTGHESIAVACIRHLLHAATRGMAGLELDSNSDEAIAQVINDDLVKVSDDTDDGGETFPESILGLYDALEGVEIGISEVPGKQDSLKTKQERIASEISKTTESRYSTDEWVFHVQGAGELRKSDPLKTLINAFVFEEDCPGKVSLMFEGCCLAASLTHDSPRLGAEWCVTDPGQPISLAVAMDWPEIVPPFCELYLRLLKNKNNSIKVLTNTTEPNDGDETSTSVMEKQFSFAIAQGRTEIAECLARCLLAAGIPTQSSPLVEATRKKASDLVIRLLAQDHGGFNAEVQAIVVAAEHCNIDILRILTEHNKSALLNAGEAAMEAATKSAHVGVPNRLEVITFILDNGVLITADKSLLLRATNSGDAELLQVLFDHDIGLEFRSEALVLATSNGDSKSTELLLRHGAERTDRLAVIRALNLGSPISAANLIKAGFQVEGRYLDKSRTALHYAAEKGFDDVVQCLLERKVLIDVYDREHKTPLHLAAQRGRARCAKLLLDHGADVLSEDGEGNIPLDLAEGGKHTATEETIKGEMQRLFDKLQEERRLRVVADDPGID